MENQSIFIIGDVHGCYRTLLALIAKLPKGAKIVFVGDLIDRGDSSKQVVDFVIKGGYDCVLGNHEEMMIWAKNGLKGNAANYCLWLKNGGISTIDSYAEIDGRFDQITFDQHVQWMETLPLTLEYKDVKNAQGEHLLISHSFAGNVYGWNDEMKTAMAYQYRQHILWGRPKQLKPLKDIYNVHGHTPLGMGPNVKSFYANIDTGCVYKDEKMIRNLTALQFPEMIVHEQENIDRKSFYF